MSRRELFHHERDLLERVEAAVRDGDDAARRLALDDLLEGYQRLLRQSEQLVRFADAQQDELQKLNETLNQQLGVAAHDLRNACTAILGFSRLLIELPMEEAQRHDLLARIHRSTSEMLTLLNDLLDISLIESGRFSLNPRLAQLDRLLRERLHEIELAAEDKQIRFSLDLHALPESRFDPARITQVIDNLLSNAIKYSRPGSEVVVRCWHSGNHIGIAVSDQGEGIPVDELSRLFRPFTRLSVQPTGGEKSTGLGLAIVKQIIDAHHGNIGVESLPGQGTTFTLHLPLAGPPEAKHA